MERLFSIALLGLLGGFALAQEGPTLESLAREHALARAQVAHIHSRAVAASTLEALLERQAAELHAYAGTAPAASAALARGRARRAELERFALLLDGPEAAKWEPLLADSDDDAFSVLLEHACRESQEKLVAVLDARIHSTHVKEKPRGPVALLDAPWGRAELLLDRDGHIRGVDLVGDERQNLLRELTR